MDLSSAFMDKEMPPTPEDLAAALGASQPLWQEITDLVFLKYPAGKESWYFPGKKYGWSFRIKDKRRALIYLTPLQGYFRVAMVFGQKATDAILNSDVSPLIKKTLKEAQPYVEGRGIYFDIHDNTLVPDLDKLITFKLKY
jgi:hypothetical protein